MELLTQHRTWMSGRDLRDKLNHRQWWFKRWSLTAFYKFMTEMENGKIVRRRIAPKVVHGVLIHETQFVTEKVFSSALPAKGDVALVCGHPAKDGKYFFFKLPDEGIFQRPDGTEVMPQWIICCPNCYEAAGQDVRRITIRGEAVWQGTDTQSDRMNQVNQTILALLQMLPPDERAEVMIELDTTDPCVETSEIWRDTPDGKQTIKARGSTVLRQ